MIYSLVKLFLVLFVPVVTTCQPAGTFITHYVIKIYFENLLILFSFNTLQLKLKRAHIFQTAFRAGETIGKQKLNTKDVVCYQ